MCHTFDALFFSQRGLFAQKNHYGMEGMRRKCAGGKAKQLNNNYKRVRESPSYQLISWLLYIILQCEDGDDHADEDGADEARHDEKHQRL